MEKKIHLFFVGDSAMARCPPHEMPMIRLLY